MMLIAAGPITAMKSVGRIVKIRGNRILTGLFSALPSLRPHFLCLSTHGFGNSNAILVGLNDGPDEGLEIWEGGSFRQIKVRLAA